MTPSSRLLTRLLPLLVPLAGCGGSTTSPTGSTGTTGGTGGTGTTGPGGSGAGATGPGGSGSGATGGSGAGATGGTGTTGTGGSGATGTGGTGAGGTAQGGTNAQGGSGQAGSSAGCSDTPLVPGVDSGYFVCAGKAIHRTTVLSCPNHLPLTDGACTSGGPGCVDASCTMAAHGYCAPNQGGGALICACHYGCLSDGECGSGQNCLCGPNIGTCVVAACTKDADCGAGSLCMSYSVAMGCFATTQFACTTANDQCQSDADCKTDGGLPNICGHDGTKRVCQPGAGLCGGRPLLVADAPRIATLTRGRSWLFTG